MQMIMKDVKIMTFDEAIKSVEAFDEDLELESWMPDSKVYEIIEQLREEYAPTVEMTKEQYELFSKLAVDEIGDQEELDAFVNEELDLGDMTVRDAIANWLHPETIKVVDE